MAEFQQAGPFKRQRIVRDEAPLKFGRGVENVALSSSIIELDKISTFDTLRMDELGEPVEYIAWASAEPNSVMLLAEESQSEIKTREEEEHPRVRLPERDTAKLYDYETKVG
ncbi:hypothetical protein CJF32_00003811 [Rutstroemia sp. NJR-2017a WRK4]|nr:hypothetical protein CJF32_00003811 [Rutstroemia sp. NJR-2017a WRK4]